MRRLDCMSVLVHGTTVAGPLASRNLPMAKGLAAERAREVLADPESEHYLPRICTCAKRGRTRAARKARARMAMEEAEARLASTEEAVAEAMGLLDVAEEAEEETPLDLPDKEELDDETNEGFAMLARLLLEEKEGRVPDVCGEDDSVGDDGYADGDLAEELEVERMIESDQCHNWPRTPPPHPQR